MTCIDHKHGATLPRLFAALGVMFGYFIVQSLVAHFTGSLALRADAFHMLVHCSCILVGIICVLAARSQYRYSQHLDLIGGAINGLLLVGMAVMVFQHGLTHGGGGHEHHMAEMASDMCSSSNVTAGHDHGGHHGGHEGHTPPTGNAMGLPLMIMAFAGILVHGFCAWLVSNGKHFLCMRGIYVNMLGHTGISLMVFLTGLAMTLWNMPYLDKWAGLLMAVLMTFLGLRQMYISIKPLLAK